MLMWKEILYQIQINHLTFLAQIEGKIAKKL